MIRFKGHDVHEEENGYVEIILHMDTSPNGLEEFAMELGHRDDELEVQKAALDYVKKHLPKINFKQIKVMVGGILVATMVGTVLVAPGGNQASAAEVGITGGQLAVDEITVGNFTAVVLNGKTQSTFANINAFNVTDPTGTGAGWNVLLSATQLTDSLTGRTLPLGSLSVVAPGLTEADTGSSPAADITKRGGTIDSGTGVSILSAAAGAGMGTYTASFAADALKLNLLPKDVRSGTYTSTITVTINSGP
nr:WxL domain-containing protein [Fredinandcohnia onubensis]